MMDIVTAWNHAIRWLARLCLHIKYGMSVDDYYKQLAFPPERVAMSAELQALSDALGLMASTGKISISAKRQEMEPYVSHPIAYDDLPMASYPDLC